MLTHLLLNSAELTTQKCLKMLNYVIIIVINSLLVDVGHSLKIRLDSNQ